MDCVLILSKLLSLIVGITRGVEGGGGVPFIYYYVPLSYTFFCQMVPHAPTLRTLNPLQLLEVHCLLNLNKS